MRAIFAAGLLALLLTGGVAAHAAPVAGFLAEQDLTDTRWLPPRPADDGAVETADLAVYLGTRALVATPRGDEAHFDDVYAPAEVAPRFAEALGVQLTPEDAPLVLGTIERAQLDLETLTAPTKPTVAAGGRVRPYVQFPVLAACPHEVDDQRFGLKDSGSYPSTHAALGMLWALILSQLAPDRTDAVFARGWAFGESRLVCGFHYPSDLAAGRMAAMVLYSRLEAQPAFRARMTAAKAQMDSLRGRPRSELGAKR